MSWYIMSDVIVPTGRWSRGLLWCWRFVPAAPAAVDRRTWALLLFQTWVGRGHFMWRLIKCDCILWGLGSCRSCSGQRLCWTKKGAHMKTRYYCRTVTVRIYRFNTDKQIMHGFGWNLDFVNCSDCSADGYGLISLRGVLFIVRGLIISTYC